MPIEQKIYNKKIELSMSFTNALAIGSIVGGLFKPLIDYAGGGEILFTVMHIWLLIFGVALHIFARSLADGLIEE